MSGNQRLDQFLRQRFPTLTRRQAEEAADGGLVRTKGGGKVKKGLRGFTADDLDLETFTKHLDELRKGNASLTIKVLYEDAELFVIDKPAGLHSHPLSLFDRDTVTNWAFHHDPKIGDEFPDIQPTVAPHRLDKETSGVLLVARTAAAFQKWREFFSGKSATKEYLAWCWGEPTEAAYTVENFLAHDSADARKMRAGMEGDPGLRGPFQEARSRINVVDQRDGFFLASIVCQTGVTHQVRIHCAEAGFPLMGDELYDPDFKNRSEKISGHLLRAVKLVAGGKTFEAPRDEFEKRFAK